MGLRGLLVDEVRVKVLAYLLAIEETLSVTPQKHLVTALYSFLAPTPLYFV